MSYDPETWALTTDQFGFPALGHRSIPGCVISVISGRSLPPNMSVEHEGEDDQSELVNEEVACEHVPWRHFRRGPGRTWNDVPWIAFELHLTRDELVSLSPEYGNQVNLDSILAGAVDKKDGDNPREVFKRAKVWEIWDKNRREVLFIAESFKEKPIRQEKDPLGLMGFFPIPRPLYALKTSDSLVPITPYSLYKDQAEELERLTCRIMALTEGVKSRGIYDGQLTEIVDLAGADDNTLVPVQNVMPYVSQGGKECPPAGLKQEVRS